MRRVHAQMIPYSGLTIQENMVGTKNDIFNPKLGVVITAIIPLQDNSRDA